MSQNPKLPPDAFERAKTDPRTSALISKLSAQDAERLRSVLSSPESIKQLLATPKAQELLRKLGGDGKK